MGKLEKVQDTVESRTCCPPVTLQMDTLIIIIVNYHSFLVIQRGILAKGNSTPSRSSFQLKIQRSCNSCSPHNYTVSKCQLVTFVDFVDLSEVLVK